MELRTKYHGIRFYEEKDIITFKKGIPGFEDLKKFIIFTAEENKLFYILQSIEDMSVGIVLVSPFNVAKEYEFKLDDGKLKELNIKGEEDVLVLNTVTLNSKLEDITVNLKAPIVINIKEKVGEQLILDKVDYSIKHPLFKEGV